MDILMTIFHWCAYIWMGCAVVILGGFLAWWVFGTIFTSIALFGLDNGFAKLLSEEKITAIKVGLQTELENREWKRKEKKKKK